MPWGLIVAALLVVVPVRIILVHVRRHVGEESGPFADRLAIVDVPLERAAASELCQRAALDVAGTRTFAKLKDSRLKVNSHLEGEGSNSQLLDFRFSTGLSHRSWCRPRRLRRFGDGERLHRV